MTSVYHNILVLTIVTFLATSVFNLLHNGIHIGCCHTPWTVALGCLLRGGIAITLVLSAILVIWILTGHVISQYAIGGLMITLAAYLVAVTYDNLIPDLMNFGAYLKEIHQPV